MQKDKIIIAVAALAIGILVGSYLLPGSTQSRMSYGMMGGRSFDNKERGGMRQNIDKHFIEEMIPHHQGAIDMAKLAETKATRSEIKNLAKDIIETQSKEIADMKAWYKEWYGSDVPEDDDGNMHGMMHGGVGMNMGTMTGDLEDLQSAKDFDLEFVRQMIPHHEMAVMMARMLASGTQRPEMQELSSNIISSQSREIQMMRQWLSEWSK